MFTVDGIEWSIPCDITRTQDMRYSDISGMMMDLSMFYDMQGTWLSYEVTLVPNPWDMDAYYQLMDVLTAPVDGHSFVMPYDNSTITITALVSRHVDVYKYRPNGAPYWYGTKFSITSNAPIKEVTLEGSITRGRAPLPDVANPSQGDSYTWNGSEWVVSTVYENADNIDY